MQKNWIIYLSLSSPQMMFVTHFLFSGNKDQILSEATIATEDILEQKEKIREPPAIEMAEYVSRTSKGA